AGRALRRARDGRWRGSEVRASRAAPVAVVVAALAAGCAATGSERAAVPVTDSAQLMVLLRPAPEPVWLRRSGELAAAYGLHSLAAWTFASLGEPCVLYGLPAQARADEVVRRLAAEPGVLTVQPVQRYRVLADAYDDPYAPLQHALPTLRLPEAHRLATGRGIRIGMVDTGVDIDHPELRGRVVEVGNFVERGEVSFTGDLHGTAIAGVLVARANNQLGMVGTAPDAGLVVAKSCWYESPRAATAVCDSYTLAQGIDFTLGAGVRVLNVSLGGPPDRVLERLLRHALEAGVVVVAAVDDGVEGGGFPADLPGVLAVQAVRPERRVPIRGATGISAPGVDVLTTAPRGAYDFASGNSFAAAHVSGLVALLLERRPELDAAAVAELLASTSRPSPDGAGGRLPDAAAALQGLDDAPPRD
ncbi:MAG TPA: S8 family serine peptidase, partial [Thermoanaerobaculia bacterium]|nr:S8 family serine peptidase [Thermoanaerobaculia bacterium]